jgi:hypothetical protein
VLLCQIFGSQCWSEPFVNVSLQDLDRFLPLLFVDPPVGAASQSMHEGLVAHFPQPGQKSPHLSLTDLQLCRGLSLCHLPVLGLFQSHQSIPIGLIHE